MPLWVSIFLTMIALIAGVIALDGLLLRMESRGWIYWRKRKRETSIIRTGMRALQQLVEPQIQHIEEDRRGRQAADHDEQGDPPGRRAAS
jgi:hypothetical protein